MRLSAIIALLLLLGAAAAGCYEEILMEKEVIRPPTWDIYYEQAELSKQTAECYAQGMAPQDAVYFYERAGRYYESAADLMVEGDFQYQMQLYISSGDAYKNANSIGEAQVSYFKALEIFEDHNETSQIEMEHFREVQRKLAEMEQSYPQMLDEVEESDAGPLFSYAIAGVVFLVLLGSVGYTVLRR